MKAVIARVITISKEFKSGCKKLALTIRQQNCHLRQMQQLSRKHYAHHRGYSLAIGIMRFVMILSLYLALGQYQNRLRYENFTAGGMHFADHTNYPCLFFSLAVAAIMFYLSEILFNSFIANTGSKRARYAKLYGDQWMLLATIRSALIIITYLIVIVVNALLCMIHFVWVDNQVTVFVIVNLYLAVMAWLVLTYSELLIPYCILQTTGVGETLVKVWRLTCKLWSRILILDLRLLIYRLLYVLTGGLISIYLYPYRTFVLLLLIQEQNKQVTTNN